MSETETNSEPYKKFAQGVFVVKSKNSSFNSDFSGLPRRLPDEGTIYATDKALKYCIRKYLHDKGKGVFVWRRDNKEGGPLTLEENYKEFFDIPDSKWKNKNNKNIYWKNKNNKDILKNLLKAIDSRLFGVTFAMKSEEKKNVSVTGSCQISYGINQMPESTFYNNEILSPYKNKETDKQRTIGNETKTLEAHYIYDFIINPNNLISDIEFIKENERQDLLLSQDDVDEFKEAICKGVNHVNSASKIGSEGELLLFIESDTEEDENTKKLKGTLLPLMKDLIKIKTPENDEQKIKIDLSEVFNKLVKYLPKDGKENPKYSIEIYYNPDFTRLEGVDKNNSKVKEKNIITLKEI